MPFERGLGSEPGIFRLAERSFDRRYESVTPSGKSLDVTRSLSFIAEGFAEALHRIVDTLIEFDEGVGRPEALLKCFLGNKLPGFFEKN